MIEFHETVQGRRYYESTLPALVRELEKLNAELARLAGLLERRRDADEGDRR